MLVNDNLLMMVILNEDCDQYCDYGRSPFINWKLGHIALIAIIVAVLI